MFVDWNAFFSDENISAHAQVDNERIHVEGQHDVFRAAINGSNCLPNDVFFEMSRLWGHERPIPK